MWQVSQAELKHFGRNRSQDASADQINRLLQRMSLTSSIVQERDLARLGSMMGVLATIGATAPFIGLFGTVWGILNSFASIATMKSSSLFAAIPAVMIFNKFARDINGFVGALDNFSAEMLAAMSRKLDEVH
jgi:biopolymer transport protein ExbB/TolQ